MLRRGNELVSITPEIMEFLKEPKALIITKANVRSRVHRRVHMDYIGVKRFDDDGQLIGEFRIVGLFTSTAYTRSTRSIPYLRRKVDNLMRRSGFDPDSHSGKAFAAVLESYSRDELFQIDEDTLYQFVLAIMHLDERPRVRVLARRDRFDRFVSSWCSCRASATTPRRAIEDRHLSGERLQGPGLGVLSVLPRRAAGARAFHHRALRRRDAEPGSRDARAARSRRWCAPGPTGSPRRSPWCTSRSRRSSSSAAIAMRFRSAIARPMCRRSRSPISG